MIRLDPIGAAAIPRRATPAHRGPCADCPSLLRETPRSATTARCAESSGRLIAWAWNGADAAPHWCPRTGRA